MSSYDGDEEDGYMTTYQQAEYGNSFPSNQPLYGPDDGVDLASGFSNDLKPKVLLMGLRRSGKSSIQNVVFHKMSPNETLFLESTNKITTDDIANTSCVQFKILDFPGQIDFFDPSFDTDTIFGGVGALVFVIDAQDDYIDAVARLGETVSRVYKINPKLKFEVFIHKVDGLTDDTKIETQRDIHQRASDDLHEASVGILGLENVHLNFYLTSIYDHSIFEAFSKVVQKLIPQLPTLENLLNLFNTNSAIEKSFLFDVSSKIYIATDYSPVDMQSYELCCDMIDVVLDISYIYGLEDDGPDHLSCFDSATYSVIRLDNNTVLLLWEVARYLALVCILREENYYRPGLIEYNYHCFRKGLLEIFEVRNHYQQQEQRRLELQTRRQGRLPQLSEGKTTNGSGGAVDVTDDCGPDAGQPCTNGVGLMDGAVRHPSAGPHNAAPVAAVSTGNSAIGRDGGAPMMLRSTSESIARGTTAYSDHVGAPTPPRSPSEKYDRNAARHSSYSTGAAGGGTGPVRELLQGHVIRTGGGAGVGEGGGGGPAGHVGNTYVMTADGSMVLVNGGADAGHS